MGKSHKLYAAVAALVLCVCAPAAWAANATITVSLTSGATNINIGKVVETSPSTSQTFHVDTSGAVTTSGPLIRIGNSTVSVPTYTVTCTDKGGNGKCGFSGSAGTASVTITVVTTGSTGSASDRNPIVSVSTGAGSTSCSSVTTGSSSSFFTCTLKKGSPETVATFSVGLDVNVLSANPTGTQSLPYTVSTSP